MPVLECLQGLKKQLLLKDFEHGFGGALADFNRHVPWKQRSMLVQRGIILHSILVSPELVRFRCQTKGQRQGPGGAGVVAGSPWR